jgi:hypothetical protein
MGAPGIASIGVAFTELTPRHIKAEKLARRKKARGLRIGITADILPPLAAWMLDAATAALRDSAQVISPDWPLDALDKIS